MEKRAVSIGIVKYENPFFHNPEANYFSAVPWQTCLLYSTSLA